MATITVTVTTQKQTVAGTHVSGSLRFQLMQGATVVSTTTSTSLQASFYNVADGDYTVEVQRVSNGGTPLGTPMTSAVMSVVPPTTEIDAPATVIGAIS